jgi:hypothetical protein
MNLEISWDQFPMMMPFTVTSEKEKVSRIFLETELLVAADFGLGEPRSPQLQLA